MRFLFLIIFAGITLAQTPIAIRNTFIINHDVQGAAIPQENPKLFFDSDQNFFVTWDDYRTGTPKYFYRRFSSNGSFLSEPGPISGTGELVPTGAGNFIAVRARYEPDNSSDDYAVNGRPYFGNQAGNQEVYLGGYYRNWCGFGWLGFNYSFTRIGDFLHNFTSTGGLIRHKKYSLTLDSLYEDTVTGINSSLHVISSKTEDNRIAVFWFDSPWEYTFDPIRTIYGRFYNQDGSIAADSVHIFTSQTSVSLHSAVTDADAFVIPYGAENYLVCYMTESYIYIRKVKHGGLMLSAPDSSALPTGAGHYAWIENTAVTNEWNGVKDILVRRNSSTSDSYFYTVLSVDVNTGQELITSVELTEKRDFGKKLFKTGEKKYLYPEVQGHDIYLVEIENFIPIHQKKVCEDPVVSNELNTCLISMPNGGYISCYRNEVGTYARIISPFRPEDDTPQRAVPFPLSVRKNGTIFNLREVQTTGGFYHIITNFDQQLIETGKDTVRDINGAPMISSGTLKLTERENRELMYLVTRDTSLVAGVMDSNYHSLAEVTILTNVGTSGYEIQKETDEHFMIRYSDYVVYYINRQLQITEGPYYNVEGIYLAQDVFADLYYSGSPGPLTRLKLSYLRTGTEKDIILGGEHQEFRIERINDANFLIYYKENVSYIKCTPYRMDGQPYSNEVVLEQVTGTYNRILAGKNDGVLMVTWTRQDETSFDIYGKSFLLSSITDTYAEGLQLPGNYSLQQNYPNPFNPETKISYSLPQPGVVELKVYDALGRLARVIESGEKPAGSYTETFDGSKFASGIYFCEMKAGSYRSVMKMLLLR